MTAEHTARYKTQNHLARRCTQSIGDQRGDGRGRRLQREVRRFDHTPSRHDVVRVSVRPDRPDRSLPALKPGGEGIIAWIAQTFLQLVLLSVIMVGQNVQSLAADARATNTYKDAETILDRLDLHTQGGLKAILDRLDEIAPPATTPSQPNSEKPSGD